MPKTDRTNQDDSILFGFFHVKFYFLKIERIDSITILELSYIEPNLSPLSLYMYMYISVQTANPEHPAHHAHRLLCGDRGAPCMVLRCTPRAHDHCSVYVCICIFFYLVIDKVAREHNIDPTDTGSNPSIHKRENHHHTAIFET